MNLQIEYIQENQKILIVSQNKFSFVDILKNDLKKYGAEVFFAPQIPKNLSSFDYCFLINGKIFPEKINSLNRTKVILIFINSSKESDYFSKILKKSKIINVFGDRLSKNDVDRILWFSLAQNKEHLLKFTVPKYTDEKKQITIDERLSRLPKLKKSQLLLLIIGLLILLHVAFVPPSIVAFFFSYKSFNEFRQEKINEARTSLNVSSFFLGVAKKLYAVVRPTYLFFSVAIPTDTVMDIEDAADITLKQAMAGLANSKEIIELLFKRDKTIAEKNQLILLLQELKNKTDAIETNLTSINQKIPTQFDSLKKIKQKLSDASDTASKLKKILAFSDSLLAKESEKKYLLLFANNMELRPGGGFLGSFGVVDVKDYSIEGIKIYDVYDADGQLLVHVEPPDPIKKYLHIPHWFLRDSNFSPDFLENYFKAQFFLEKEMKMSDFSGAILITTTGIQNLLSAFGDIYLPDFNDTINDKNFYLKAQIYAETNFFPGSTQKKTFLGSLEKQIMLNLKDASGKKLGQALKKSLDEKQIVIYSNDDAVQNVLDSFYWSGRVIEPQCNMSSQNCIIDYIFPYDANVGANKANFFISRSLILKTSINKEGAIRHLFSIQYKNEAPSDEFPGATYHNYFQVLLPKNSQIIQITKDGTVVEDVTETGEQLKNIGFYFEIPPKKITEIKIDYQIATPLPKGNTMYQFVVQKQIGMPNNDLAMEFNLDKSISALSHNFSPLVKEGEIIYNTNLTTDKIFFIELVKE